MIDFNAEAWHGLRTWAEGQLKKAREKNDSATLSEMETAALRGEIRFIKRFLALPKTAAQELVVSPDE